MTFVHSAELEELRASVRRFFADKSPEPEVRRLMATTVGYEPAVWRQMGSDLCLQGLMIPEQYGGAGYGFTEMTLVLEEMGRALLPTPFFATIVLAANALLLMGDDAANSDYLPGIASGETIATLALTEPGGRWGLEQVQLTATRSSHGHTLTGVKSFVLDGHIANLILVVARTDEGLGLFAVDGEAANLVRTPLATMDQTRKLARLEFAETPARRIGSAGGAEATLRKMLDLTSIALAAEAVGGAQKCLEMSVDYAKTRVQFGRPIGSFQAIKHKCANMLYEVEASRVAAYHAVSTAAEDSEETPIAASLAVAYCSEAYFQCAVENIHVHGGIGFTWEHPASLYYKRAKSSELLFGGPAYHREQLAQRLGV